MNIEEIPEKTIRANPRIDILSNVAKNYKPSSVVFPSGYSIFDDAMVGGFRGGDLVVISGQTSQGKTTYAQLLTKNLSDKGVPSLWFTYEMNPYYLKEQFDKMGCDDSLLAYSPLKLDKWDIGKSMSMISEAIEDYACKIVFIDHLHYLIPLGQATNTSLIVGGVLRELKQLAVKTNTVIVLIAHTKKLADDEELSLDSMRDSSLIAQEADSVFLVQRLKKTKKKLGEVVGSRYTTQTKVELAKVRRTGKVCFQIFDFMGDRLIPAKTIHE